MGASNKRSRYLLKIAQKLCLGAYKKKSFEQSSQELYLQVVMIDDPATKKNYFC